MTCWTLACGGLDEVIVLRVPCLTTERLRRLAAWRADTGIRLTLLAHAPERDDEQRLLEHLTAAGLVSTETVCGKAAVLEAIDPAAAGRRTAARSRPPAAHAVPQRCGRVPRGLLAPADRHRLRAQRRPVPRRLRCRLRLAGPHLPPPPALVGGIGSADGPAEPTLFTLQETEAVWLFLARLTVSSPSAAHTVARVRGAQAVS